MTLFPYGLAAQVAADQPMFSVMAPGVRFNLGYRANSLFSNPLSRALYEAGRAEQMNSLEASADRNAAMQRQLIAAGMPLNVNQAQIARDNQQRQMNWAAQQQQADRDAAYQRAAIALDLEGMRQPFQAAQNAADRSSALDLQALRNDPAYAGIAQDDRRLSQQSQLTREQMQTALAQQKLQNQPLYARMGLDERLAGMQQDTERARQQTALETARIAAGPELSRNQILGQQVANQRDLGMASLESELLKQQLANAPDFARISATRELGLAGLENAKDVATIQTQPGLAAADAARQGSVLDYQLGRERIGLGDRQLEAQQSQFGQDLAGRLLMADEGNTLQRDLAGAQRDVERARIEAGLKMSADQLGVSRDQLAAQVLQAAADRGLRRDLVGMQLDASASEGAAQRESQAGLLQAQLGAAAAEGAANRGLDRDRILAGLATSAADQALRRELLGMQLGASAEEGAAQRAFQGEQSGLNRTLQSELAGSALGLDRQKLAASVAQSHAEQALRRDLLGMQLDAASTEAGAQRDFQGEQGGLTRALQRDLAQSALGFDREKLTATMGESAADRAARERMLTSQLEFQGGQGDAERQARAALAAGEQASNASLQESRLKAAAGLAQDSRQFEGQQSGLERNLKREMQQVAGEQSLLSEALQSQRYRDVAQIEAGSRLAAVQQGNLENAMQAAIAQAQSPDPITAAQGKAALATLQQQTAATLPLSAAQQATVAPPPDEQLGRVSGLLSTLPRDAGVADVLGALSGQAGTLAENPRVVGGLLDALSARGITTEQLALEADRLRNNPARGVLFSAPQARHDFQPAWYDQPAVWLNRMLGTQETAAEYQNRLGQISLLEQLLQAQGR